MRANKQGDAKHNDLSVLWVVGKGIRDETQWKEKEENSMDIV